MQIKRFGIVKTPVWKQVQAQRARVSNMAQKFLNDSSQINSALTNAQINLSTGMATLAAQASIQRAQAEMKASFNKLV